MTGEPGYLLARGDARRLPLPDGSVNCVVTSPPYWGLRDYGEAAQIGLEPSPQAYVAALVAAFREVRRVLTADGMVWLNLGDTYVTKPIGAGSTHDPKWKAGRNRKEGHRCNRTNRPGDLGLKHKDLVGIPWRVALALQADGWWLRDDVIWHKTTTTPHSVRDRPHRVHEYVFLLTKSARYSYDRFAVKEKATHGDHPRTVTGNGPRAAPPGQPSHNGLRAGAGPDAGRQCRSVWSIPAAAFPGAHFATMAPAVAERCVKAGAPERGRCPACKRAWRRVTLKTAEADPSANGSRFDAGKTARRRVQKGERYVVIPVGWEPSCQCPRHDPEPCAVLDPFCGAGTTLMVAHGLGRNAVGIDLSGAYLGMALGRIADGLRPVSKLDPPSARAPLPGQQTLFG